MSTTTLDDVRLATGTDRSQSQVMRRAARRWRYVTNAAAAVLSAVLVIWTLTPIYNLVMVSLESHSDVFSDNILPGSPSLEGYWVVFTQGYWYLANFWHQFGNSIYVGASTTILTLLIGSAASFSISRMRIR